MSGYSSRTRPAEGKEHDLYVKALALEDADGGRLVLVASDLLGLPRSLSETVARAPAIEELIVVKVKELAKK